MCCRLQVQQESHQQTSNQQTISSENNLQVSVVSEKFEGMSEQERQTVVEQVISMQLAEPGVTESLNLSPKCMRSVTDLLPCQLVAILHVLDVLSDIHKLVYVILQILGESEGQAALSLVAQTPAEASEQ